MFIPKGSSFVEVLISLALFSFSSLALFQYQFQVTKQYQSLQQDIAAQQRMNDLSEIFLGSFSLPTLLKEEIRTQYHAYSLTNNTISLTYFSFKGMPPKQLKRCV